MTRSVVALREGFDALPCRVLACALAMAGCDPGGTECSCEPTGLRLQICSELAGQVEDIALSGSACATASRTAIDGGSDGGGVTYDIQPHETGQCTIQVSFKNGLTFTASGAPSPLTITHGPSCCGGFYPDPLSAGDIQACPLAEAGADAGAPRDGASGS